MVVTFLTFTFEVLTFMGVAFGGLGLGLIGVCPLFLESKGTLVNVFVEYFPPVLVSLIMKFLFISILAVVMGVLSSLVVTVGRRVV